MIDATEIKKYVQELTPEQRTILRKNLNLLEDKLDEERVGILDIMSFAQDINLTILEYVRSAMDKELALFEGVDKKTKGK